MVFPSKICWNNKRNCHDACSLNFENRLIPHRRSALGNGDSVHAACDKSKAARRNTVAFFPYRSTGQKVRENLQYERHGHRNSPRNSYPGACALAPRGQFSLVKREENEGSRPNRMETRFLEIAYLENLRKELAFPCDLTNELSTYSNRSGRIAPPGSGGGRRAWTVASWDVSRKRDFISRIS